MKLIWSPETATKAYIDTVKSCDLCQESGVAELISAMAAGWNAKLIVETWIQGGVITTSIGLSIASKHTSGRHVCIVPNEDARAEYTAAMKEAGMSPEVIVGEAEEVLGGETSSSSLSPPLLTGGIDFLVVDCQRRDFARVLRLARLSQKGAVLMCKNASSLKGTASFRWRSVLDGRYKVVKTAFLPVGKGLDIAHIASTVAAENGGGSSGGVNSNNSGRRRWIKHVDKNSGEEHVIRT